MQLTRLGSVPFRQTDFLPVDLAVERRSDGAIVLRSRIPLQEFEPCLPRALAAQAARLGNKPYLVQRLGPQRAWTPHSYTDTKRDTDAIAQWLLNRGIARDRPILLLSGNSIAHALVKFGGMAVGVPACPVSANYGLMDANFARLRHVVQLTRPGVVFVENARPFARALEQVDFGDAIVLTATPDDAPRGAESLASVLATPVTGAVAERIAALRGEDHAAYMLTSGSTGPPKAVVQTYANIAANIAQALQTIGEAAGWRGTTMDWLPWNHVSGAFGKMLTLVAGGTLYIDEGKPVPGPLWQESLRNLREVPGSYYVNVPLGYQLLVEALEADEDLRRTFFRDLKVLLYGGAGLPQPIYERLQRLAVSTIGQRIMLVSAYGSTETTSGCLAIHFETDKVGLGVPMPGIRVKLVPVDTRYEVRIAGPVVTPCYLRDPQRTAESRDEEGYYRMGDLAVFHDPAAARTRVSVRGPSRGGIQARQRNLGERRTTARRIAAPARAAGRRAGSLRRRLYERSACSHGRTARRWRAQVLQACTARFANDSPRTTQRIRARARACAACCCCRNRPMQAAHELSDKGTVNRSAVLARRAADVERLYAESPAADVIVID